MKTSKLLFLGILTIALTLTVTVNAGNIIIMNTRIQAEAHEGDTIGFDIGVGNPDTVNPLVIEYTEYTFAPGTICEQIVSPIPAPLTPTFTLPKFPDTGYLRESQIFFTMPGEDCAENDPGDFNKLKVFGDILASGYTLLGDGSRDPTSGTGRSGVRLLLPCIEVTKTVEPTTSKVGDTVVYTIEICNCGNIELTLLEIYDELLGDPDTGLIPIPPECEVLAGGVWEEVPPDSGNFELQPGGCCTIEIPYTIQADDPDPLVNEVCVLAADPLFFDIEYPNPDAAVVQDCDTATVDLVDPKIQITKDCEPQTASVGDVITYTITIENTSTDDPPIALENVVVTDPLLGAGPLPGFPDTLAQGESHAEIFTRAIQPTDPNPLQNTSTVHANPVGLDNDITDDDSCQVDIGQPDTTVDIKANGEDGPITVCEGEEVTLTICEDNTGDVDLTNVYVQLSVDGVITPLVPPLDKDNPTLSGDTDGDDELDTDEEWCWTVLVTPTAATTIYDAIGHGTDPAGNDITPDNGYENEYDDVEVLTEPCGGEGCTPGFWKNSPGCWCDEFEPTDLFSDVFDVDPFTVGKGKKAATDPTLMEALNANGGGIDALARHATAALLNACSADVDYPMSVAQVIGAVQAVLPDGDIEGLHSEFAGYNELGCPISADNSANPCQRSDTDGS